MFREEHTPTIHIRTGYSLCVLRLAEAKLSPARRAVGVIVADDVVGEWGWHGG